MNVNYCKARRLFIDTQAGTHAPVTLSFTSLRVANTFRQMRLTSLLFPPRGPDSLARKYFISKLISGLLQMIKQYASEVLALLTCVMRLTAAHTWQWHHHGQSAQQAACVCASEMLVARNLTWRLHRCLADQFSPLQSIRRLWIFPHPRMW